jgi:signal transduction histidine kinase
MSNTGKNGIADTDQVKSDENSISSGIDRQRILRGTDRRRTERTVKDDETAIQNREESVTRREDVAHSREDAADLREDAAQLREGITESREREIRAVEILQAASQNHLAILQEANARLVIATVEAQRLAEEVQVATTQLEVAKSVAEKASHAKSSFLSSMSHELRTPLNAILGFAQLMEASSPPPTPNQASRLQQIIHSGWYLLELINEILDLATIESGKLILSTEPVSLAEVMLECQGMVEVEAQKHDVHLNFLPLDDSWFIFADRTRFKQALLNLLSNAIKYNRKHGTVEVKCTSMAEHIRISIKDSGMGLPAEKVAQLFQAFNRLGQESGTEEGTGIGLVVTKQLVELMGGTIGVESTVGVGSEFWIELNRYYRPPHDATLAAENILPVKSASK